MKYNIQFNAEDHYSYSFIDKENKCKRFANLDKAKKAYFKEYASNEDIYNGIKDKIEELQIKHDKYMLKFGISALPYKVLSNSQKLYIDNYENKISKLQLKLNSIKLF